MKAAELFDITDNHILITGAAGGLGRAIATVCATNGAHVHLADTNSEALQSFAAELSEPGGRVYAHHLDVTDRKAVMGLIEGLYAKHGRFDTLFANAGIGGGPGPAMEGGSIDEISSELWHQVLEINLTGVLHCMQGAAKVMKAQGGGRIVVTSSAVAMRPNAQVGYPYIASKAAVTHLVRQAALDLAPFNILVNAMAPGPFDTGLSSKLDADVLAEKIRRLSSEVLLGRIARPDEIMGLTLLLASPASSFMTGGIYLVDGGVK
jgi:NAD(P)-dependent dehydrogenase (short-subunit alcohol dehydrogenase family)